MSASVAISAPQRVPKRASLIRELTSRRRVGCGENGALVQNGNVVLAVLKHPDGSGHANDACRAASGDRLGWVGRVRETYQRRR